jgi:hypothetical protein
MAILGTLPEENTRGCASSLALLTGNVSNGCVLQDRRICDTTLPAPRCMLVFVNGRIVCKGVLLRVPAG